MKKEFDFFQTLRIITIKCGVIEESLKIPSHLRLDIVLSGE